jgi:hypothetical protein
MEMTNKLYEYKVVNIKTFEMEKELNRLGTEGWEPVQVPTPEPNFDYQKSQSRCIFRRELPTKQLLTE